MTTSSSDLYTFGEVMVLFVAEDTDSVVTARHYELQVVGAEANVAVAVARLGLKARFMSRVGTDQLGQVVIDELAQERVDVSRVSRVNSPTGTMVRNRGNESPVEISYLRTASAGSTIAPHDIDPMDITSTRWLHVTGISAAISESSRNSVVQAMHVARSHNVPISFDLNIRRKLWSEEEAGSVLRQMVKDVQVVFGGGDEYSLVWGSQDPRVNLEKALDAGVRTAIMTSGAGVIRVLNQGDYWEYQPPTVVAVDPVGSGDAFVGGIISGLLAGLDLREAIAQGSVGGASVAQRIGDWAGLPYGVEGRMT